MLPLLHALAGLAAGAAAGWFLEQSLHWRGATAIGAASGCAGQVCRAVLAWLSRPSEQTRKYQDRISTVPVVASILLGFCVQVGLLRFPATVIAPAASYLLVRVLLSWQARGPGTLSRTTLQFAARGGEFVTLSAALIAHAEPLS